MSIERDEGGVIYVPTIVRNDELRMQQENGENGLATKKTGRIISICHRKWSVHIVYAPLSRQEACKSSPALSPACQDFWGRAPSLWPK